IMPRSVLVFGQSNSILILCLSPRFISDNKLPYFPHALFEGESYTSLRYLHADHNDISNMTTYSDDQYTATNLVYYNTKKYNVELFGTARYLQELYLHENQIEKIESEAFIGTVGYLYLRRNKIEIIESEAFTGSFRIYLYSNLIRTINSPMFGSGSTAYILDLHDNKISKLTADVFTGVNIEYRLYLHNNILRWYPVAALSNQNLQEITLSDNQITTIPNSAFTAQSNLRKLYLDNNLMAELQDGVFDGLNNLETL
uniref:SLIT and NTRK-like protein 4-like n=1 Tax=Saccoglossus kowalevskii TaxID=10224 RepID=A0ABM0M2K6_SACKO